MATIENSLRLLAANTSTLKKLLQTFVVDPHTTCRKIKTGLVSQLPESQIYKNVVTTEPLIKDSTWLYKRAVSRAQLRLKILRDLRIVHLTYMDYGAGEGDITIETHKLLMAQNPDRQISGYAVDVAEWHGHQNLAISSDFKLANITLEPALLKFDRFYDLLPFIPDQSLDVVFVEMVLHHLPNDVKNRLYRTLHRTLSPSGCVIIREHGPSTPTQTAYIHAQHGLYGAFEESQAQAETFFSSYYAKYHSREVWVEEWRSMDFLVRPLSGENQWLNQPFGEASTFYTVLQKPPYSLNAIYRYLKVKSPIATPRSPSILHIERSDDYPKRLEGWGPVKNSTSLGAREQREAEEQKIGQMEAHTRDISAYTSGVRRETESVEPRLIHIGAPVFNTMCISTEIVSPVPISLTNSIGNRTLIEKRVEFGVWSYRLHADRSNSDIGPPVGPSKLAIGDTTVKLTRLDLLVEILSRLDPSQKSTAPIALRKWMDLLQPPPGLESPEALGPPEPEKVKSSASSEKLANDLAIAIASTMSYDPAQHFCQSAHLCGSLTSLQLFGSPGKLPLQVLILGFLINGFSTKEILIAVANLLL